MNLIEIIKNYDHLTKEEIEISLKNDNNNKFNLTYLELQNFMEKYSLIAVILSNHSNIYLTIKKLTNNNDEDTEREVLGNIIDNIITKTVNYSTNITPQDYQKLFSYYSLKEYCLNNFGKRSTDLFLKQLNNKPQNYFYTLHIPINLILNEEIFPLISRLGLENIEKFSAENNNCLYAENYKLLKIICQKARTVNVNRISKSNPVQILPQFGHELTYQDFENIIEKTITCGYYKDQYNQEFMKIKGPFRNKYPYLFLSDDAPQKLKELFYQKNLTPNILKENPEYKKYLEKTQLFTVFKPLYVNVNGNAVNIYKYLTRYLSNEQILNYLIEYSEIITIALKDISMETNIWKDNYNKEVHNVKIKENNINDITKELLNIFKTRVIQLGFTYNDTLSDSVKQTFPELFLPDQAPEELKKHFYNRTITIKLLNEHPEWSAYLKNINLELLTKYTKKKTPNGSENLIKIISDILGPSETIEFLKIYGNYLTTQIIKLPITSDLSKLELYGIVNQNLQNTMQTQGLKCDEYLEKVFRKLYPFMFLDPTVPIDIRQNFYQRTLTIEKLEEHPDSLKNFTHTNIALGFPTSYIWLLPLFDKNNPQESNLLIYKIIKKYNEIQNDNLKSVFRSYIIENKETIQFSQIDTLADILYRLSISNSSEITSLAKELGSEIIKKENPYQALNKVEQIFSKNDIPTVGKIYSCFRILHPNFEGYDFSEKGQYTVCSPTLRKKSNLSRKVIIFSDLVKSSFGSGNRSAIEYISNIEKASLLYEHCVNYQININKLAPEELELLTNFRNALVVLYHSSAYGKKDNFQITNNPLEDIANIKHCLPKGKNTSTDLQDKIISSFCHFAGFNTIKDVKDYITFKMTEADKRGRKYAELEKFTIEKGDFIKSVNMDFIELVLQNGVNANDFLGADAKTDATPLDTDLSRVMTPKTPINDMIDAKNQDTGYFGKAYFILKNNPHKIAITKSHFLEGTSPEKIENVQGRLEAFVNGPAGDVSVSYGIRTGFPATDIDYIIFDQTSPEFDKLRVLIAQNGYYIPIVSKQKGTLIYSPADYDSLRQKMEGLKNYGSYNYTLSDNLYIEEIMPILPQMQESHITTRQIRDQIISQISASFPDYKIETKITKDLSQKTIQIIEIGSTSRGTNEPSSYDYDFIVRIDGEIIHNSQKLQTFKQTLASSLEISDIALSGDIKHKKININNTSIDVDFSFAKKTDKIDYSAEMCNEDKLTTIAKLYPDKIDIVRANIIYAKKYLKENKVYKKKDMEGGLGGIGVENWILQNGGSFYDAARTFVEASYDNEGKPVSYNNFCRKYEIWNFGQDHYVERENEKNGTHQLLYTNFTKENLTEEGYHKMVEALTNYLSNTKKEKLTK